jgi:endonuclease/exonuclease/phosphatase family metal-dependent hydrolase
MRPKTYCIALLCAVLGTAAVAQEAGDSVRVMTFNIRYGTAEDGDNAWDRRRQLVAAMISRHHPDALAIQEGLAFQLDQLSSALGGYRKLGQHRNGGQEGEFSGLYVNEDRVRVLRWGEFWLSSAPDSVGSIGWDAALPRMAVWADLERSGGGGTFRVYGTHFDHRGEMARVEGARLIGRHAAAGPPAIIMGDLNAGEADDPLQALFDLGYASAYGTLHPESETGTFNGFQDPTGGRRLDHILLDPRLSPLQAEIVTDRGDGVWPSDHFPVVALFSIGPPETSLERE